LTAPTTVTVGLAFSVRTIRRRPFERVTSTGRGGASGTFKLFTEASAQAGRATGLVGAAVVTSAPPKPLLETGSPEDAGFRVATTALSTVR
jgi:fructoselysine-6-P-deglycase FrlB-like protein